MLPYKASYHKQWKPLAGKIEIRKYSRQKARRIQCIPAKRHGASSAHTIDFYYRFQHRLPTFLCINSRPIRLDCINKHDFIFKCSSAE
jgi:hypothetical protein